MAPNRAPSMRTDISMAFDAAASAAPPAIPGTGAAVKPAGRKGDSADPFGALVAMLDQANAETPAPEAPAAAPEVQGGEVSAAPKTGADDVPAKDDKPAEAPAADAATLVAAMMAPAPPPTAPPTAAQAAQPAGGPASAPAPAAPEEPAAIKEAELSSKLAGQAAPPLQAPTPVKVDKAAVSASAELKPAAAEPPAPAAPQAAPIAAVQTAEQPQTPEADQTRLAVAANPAVQDGEARPDNTPDPRGRDRENSASADADAARLAQARKASAPDAQAFAQLDPADAAPQAPSNPLQSPPPPTAAAAPVITAQAAFTPVRGSPETVAHLAAQMIQRLDGRTTRFDLSLNPQSLGRVDVRIEIGAKGVLRARMAFDDAASAHELSGRHAELRAALQSAGFDVPEGAITYDVASGGGSGTGGAFAERQDASGHPAPAFNTLADTADQDVAASAQTYFRAAGSSGLDIRV